MMCKCSSVSDTGFSKQKYGSLKFSQVLNNVFLIISFSSIKNFKIGAFRLLDLAVVVYGSWLYFRNVKNVVCSKTSILKWSEH